MRHKDFLIKILFLGLLLYVLHKLALDYYLYFILDWFDVFMHLLGGFWIGLLGVYFMFLWGRLPFWSQHKVTATALILLFVLSTGLVWELIELFGGLTDIVKDLGDTIFDLVCDMIGGALAIYLSRFKLWPEE